MLGNLTAFDMLKMGKTLSEDDVYEMANSYESKIDEMQKELDMLRKQTELAQEQTCFAIEIIEQVEYICRTETRAKDIKAEISSTIENSYLER